ncbi:PEP-CTERM sorting domain-containing protein [Aerosakkonemataceae cyanobacterium BLCC-F154]|uniref:PEP-CTERM sorting domain-containing protein n=1 Tax=Floridaenema fluviatile BLCC-F154 TaxID=3153640 RepID=A0ABV4YJA1_9CYAN
MSTTTVLKFFTLTSLVSLSLILDTNPSSAAILNGNFDPNLDGWTSLGDVGVQNSQALLKTDTVNDNYAALEQFLNSPAGGLDQVGNGEVFQGSALKQIITAEAGEVLTFNWNFLTNEPAESTDFNDFAFFTINGNPVKLGDTFSEFSSSATPFEKETGFKSKSYKFQNSGTYTLGFGVVDVYDAGKNSGLLIDNVALSKPASSVPEPSTVLGVLVLGSLGAIRRFLHL